MQAMFFERSEVGKLGGMTGCLLSMLFIRQSS
jgi:hypothetical protein